MYVFFIRGHRNKNFSPNTKRRILEVWLFGRVRQGQRVAANLGNLHGAILYPRSFYRRSGADQTRLAPELRRLGAGLWIADIGCAKPMAETCPMRSIVAATLFCLIAPVAHAA